MVQNGIFWTIGEQTYFVYYPIIYYQRIKVYRVDTIWYGNIPLEQWCQWDDSAGAMVSVELWYLLYEIWYFGKIPTMISVCTWSHTLNNVWFLVIDFCKEHGSITTQLRNSTHTGKVIAFYLQHISRHTSLNTNTIVSSLAAGRPIKAWTEIFLQKDVTNLLSFFWSGLRGPKAYSLWGGVVPSPSIGYEYL